jgi:hypothetical protein
MTPRQCFSEVPTCLAALIADRAIERVVDQQELHHTFARLFDHGRTGVDDLGRAIAVGREVIHAKGAGGLRLRHARHLDEAHAAIAGNGQALVVAETGDLDPCLLTCLEKRNAVLDLDFGAVDDQRFRHSLPVSARGIKQGRATRHTFAALFTVLRRDMLGPMCRSPHVPGE